MTEPMTPGVSEPDEATASQDHDEQEAPVRLFEADELNAVIRKWRDIQADFVDQPKRAMQEADELVGELMNRLARTFTEQREQLEARWGDSETVSTEDLRKDLQRYRSFFERLLAA
jgi:hypothetical protein